MCAFGKESVPCRVGFPVDMTVRRVPEPVVGWVVFENVESCIQMVKMDSDHAFAEFLFEKMNVFVGTAEETSTRGYLRFFGCVEQFQETGDASNHGLNGHARGMEGVQCHLCLSLADALCAQDADGFSRGDACVDVLGTQTFDQSRKCIRVDVDGRQLLSQQCVLFS